MENHKVYIFHRVIAMPRYHLRAQRVGRGFNPSFMDALQIQYNVLSYYNCNYLLGINPV